jgi:hypothetical protein
VSENNADDFLVRLALEVWRFGSRVAHYDGSSLDRLADSHARLLVLLEEAHIRIDDPTGRRFIEGSSVQIIDAPTGVDTLATPLTVVSVLRPNIYIDDKLALEAQVILELAPVEVSSGPD